ncbi:MAG: hypothetical protein RIT10_1228 [Bacteroidota bacterium]|jgi:hypothetical protein
MYLLSCKPACWPDCDDWILFVLGIIVSIGWALFIYTLRPKVRIGIPQISKVKDKSIIVIPVENLKKHSKATRILIEICVIKEGYTYHLISDSNDFAYIPKMDDKEDNIRMFKVYKLNGFLTEVYPEIAYETIMEYLQNKESKLRVRIHATHSFSGLGKTFEKIFF